MKNEKTETHEKTMKYEKPLTVICNGKETKEYVASNDGSSSCSLALGCCVRALYR